MGITARLAHRLDMTCQLLRFAFLVALVWTEAARLMCRVFLPFSGTEDQNPESPNDVYQ